MSEVLLCGFSRNLFSFRLKGVFPRPPIVLRFLFGLFLGWLLTAAPLAVKAAPCYGGRLPQAKRFVLGSGVHAVFKRDLEGEFGKVRSRQAFLLVSYGLSDRLSVDLKGGAGNIKQRLLSSCETDYPSGFAGGYGFRFRFCRRWDLDFILGFQHISVHPRKIHVEDQRNMAVLDDWQWSLLVSPLRESFRPYAGFKWSRLDYIHWMTKDDRKRRMSDLTKSFGLFFGVDLPLDSRLWINLEAQVLDGKACSFSLNYAF